MAGNIHTATATHGASTYEKDLEQFPGRGVTSDMTVTQNATAYPRGTLFMSTAGKLVAWDGSAGTLVAVASFEIDATAGDVVCGVLVKANVYADVVVRPGALADDQAMRDAAAGSDITIISKR